MYQGFAPQVEVDKGGDNADLGATQPCTHVLGPVLHKKGDGLPMLETRGQKEVCNTIAVLVQLK